MKQASEAEEQSHLTDSGPQSGEIVQLSMASSSPLFLKGPPANAGHLESALSGTFFEGAELLAQTSQKTVVDLLCLLDILLSSANTASHFMPLSTRFSCEGAYLRGIIILQVQLSIIMNVVPLPIQRLINGQLSHCSCEIQLFLQPHKIQLKTL